MVFGIGMRVFIKIGVESTSKIFWNYHYLLPSACVTLILDLCTSHVDICLSDCFIWLLTRQSLGEFLILLFFFFLLSSSFFPYFPLLVLLTPFNLDQTFPKSFPNLTVRLSIAQLVSACLSLSQLVSAWLSLAQFGSAWLSLAQLCFALLLFYFIFWVEF